MFSGKELPKGYRFVDAPNISADEAVSLWRKVEYVRRNGGSYDPALAEWDDALQEAITILGVQDRNRALVGMATLDGDEEWAWLNHLAVHPDHQHQGIGRTLVKERVRIADRLGVAVLNVCLMSSNTLRPLYHKLGFEEDVQEYDILRRTSTPLI